MVLQAGACTCKSLKPATKVFLVLHLFMIGTVLHLTFILRFTATGDWRLATGDWTGDYKNMETHNMRTSSNGQNGAVRQKGD